MKCSGVIFTWERPHAASEAGRASPWWRSADASRVGGARWSMDINNIVIVSLTSPREKVWGQLVQLESKGVTVRGIEIDSFDDFLRQVIDREETTVGMTTVFYPMHRVERIAVDEPSGCIPSLAERFHRKAGVTIQEYLGIGIPR